jgi:hypothetical protein
MKNFAYAELPPEKTAFSEQVIKYNRLDEAGFEEWLFYPGMIFGSTEKWWGDFGTRPTPHEGIDLCLFRNQNSSVLQLDGTSKIPVTYNGEIVKIDKDFLGKSLYIRHDIFDSAGRQFYTIYGHTEPVSDAAPGTRVKAGDIVASISEAKKIKIFSHLHISMAWIPASCSAENLNWVTLADPEKVTLLNPLNIIGCKYSIYRNSCKNKS